MEQRFFIYMAYPAAVIYALLYVIIIAVVRLTYLTDLESALFITGLFFLYPILWGALFLIDRDRRNRNLPAALLIESLCRNTGVNSWNFILVAISILGCIASVFMSPVLLPLAVVIAVGTLVNLISYSDKDWKVKSPTEDIWKLFHPDDTGKVRVKTQGQDKDDTESFVPDPDKTLVTKKFTWKLEQSFGIKDLDNVTEVQLYKDDFDIPDEFVRKENPFRKKGGTFQEKVPKVLKGPQTSKDMEDRALRCIIESAGNICKRYNMADFELLELLVHFCRHCLHFQMDIGGVGINADADYVRFPSELLYDENGDCDCKSALAYRLLETLGLDVKYVTTTKKTVEGTAHAFLLINVKNDNYNFSKKYLTMTSPRFKDYAICEPTTGGPSRIGFPYGYEESLDVVAETENH